MKFYNSYSNNFGPKTPMKVFASPKAIRNACRSGDFSGQTAGQAPGYAQANLCILPKEFAYDFLLFCQRNPKPCPLLYVLDEGSFDLNDIDIRSDCPKYRIFREGVLSEEVTNISNYWQNDFVTFVIGCSFSFEDALINAGLKLRHIEEGKTVPMYTTSIPCNPAGIFHGNLVVSMRPFVSKDAIKAVEISSRYPRVHGSPVHLSNPLDIGIVDISKPDFGDSVTIGPGETPVFWACGVTPQVVVMTSKPSICITHSPGHMLVLDDLNEEL